MAWKLVPTIVNKTRNYLVWNLHCISDGNALTATDILSETYMPRDMKPKIQGLIITRVKADPGAANQPDQAWDFTLSDRDQDAILTVTNSSYTAPAYVDASTNLGMYPEIEDRLYIAFPTAGDWTSGDIVDLVFTCYRDSGNP